ncbi:hypothetical protein V1224_08885 [Lachnospiraceae bacterium JLR.KK008]
MTPDYVKLNKSDDTIDVWFYNENEEELYQIVREKADEIEWD